MIGIQIVLSYILFALAIFITFYLPGIFLLSFAKNAFVKNEKQFFAWPIGYSVFILLSYAGAWIHFPWLSLVFALLSSLYIVLKKRELIYFTLPNVDWVVIVLILVGSLAFTNMSFLSGIQTANGYQLIGKVNATDGLMHIAHIKTQVFSFPPPHASFAGYTMHGYHYFYDFLLSRFVLFFHFSAEDVFYRLFPLAVSLFYGISIYFFSKLFTTKKSTIRFILFFAYFAQSWSFILSLFTKTVNITNGLGLVQPLELILDPSAIVSIALIFCGFYILLQGKLNIQKALLTGLVLGPLAEMKVYGGIVSIFTLGGIIIYLFLKKKPVGLYILTVSIICVLTGLTYLPNNIGMGHLLIFPFFLYDIFIRQNQLFRSWNYDMRMVIYQEHKNILHLYFMYGVAFILFWILTLGSRIFVLFGISSLLRKEFWTKKQNICLVIFITFPLFLGSVFIQSFSAFSTIQFLWMTGLFIAIPAGIFYGNVYEKLSKKFKIVLVIFLLVCSSGATLANFSLYIFQYTKTIISPSQMKLVATINTTIGESEFFVVIPSHITDKHGNRAIYYTEAPLFAALSSRETYYEYETPEYSDQKLILHRKQQIEFIANRLEKCNGIDVQKTMQTIGAKYFVTTENIPCSVIPGIQKIQTAQNWTFWEVK